MLMVLSSVNGKLLSRTTLPAPPVYEGLAAADGRLYVSSLQGTLLCLGQ